MADTTIKEKDAEEEDDPIKENKALKGVLFHTEQKLFKARLVLLFGEINMDIAQHISSQLLALDVSSQKPIRLIINSPGGHVEAGDTLHDMIKFIRSPVYVLGTGWVASAGVHIFLGVCADYRYALPNTRFMIHQPRGGAGGRAADIAIEAKEIIKTRARLNRIIAQETGQPLEQVEKDTDRNYWMSAQEAREYGLVKTIIQHYSEFRG